LSGRLAYRAETIEMVCKALEEGDRRKAGDLVRRRYPFDPPLDRRRAFTKYARARVFLRDGFLDRYSGDRLLFPPVLEVISASIPDDFPLRASSVKMANSHVAHWELYASVDHVVPVARGGVHEMDNWVTTSFMHNLIKSHWRLDDLGWELLPPGRLEEWDGMLGWFLKFTEEHPDTWALGGIRDWRRAATRAMQRH
jgi:5-methylcytosine-specific restriction endonuclease McrA